ncbi:MAG: MmcQ/YjbR family DNA-binding protein [Deltaproteobacteria bacterium]|nr:MmcQ/YjbR family DNA-binding protein [Deltaproteobacteria bacterium]
MNESNVSPAVLERLRAICLALPEAKEQPAHGDPSWRIRKKIFAAQKGNYDGGRPSVWMKAPDGAQAALMAADPELFFSPPYVGHKGWLGVWLDVELDWDELEELVRDSYRLVAPKKLAKLLEDDDE